MAAGFAEKGITMKNHIKAALLSAFVLPGMGQLYRGRALKGGILLLLMTVLILAALIVSGLVLRDVLPVPRPGGAPDGAALRRWLPQILTLGGAFCVIWLYSVVDALLDRVDGGEDDRRSSPPPGGTTSR